MAGVNWLREFDKAVGELRPALVRGEYEPTGVQDDLIRSVGESCVEAGILTVVVTFDPNKTGKTATGVNVVKAIVGGVGGKWFDYPAFRKWPYPRGGRIVGTAQNTADTGQIRKEIATWWPEAHQASTKGGKDYHSQYMLNGSTWDVMTYNQEPDEFEGPLLGWTWLDEPPPARLMGAILSRFSHGGLLLITGTGVGANIGAFMDSVDDLRSRTKDEDGKERLRLVVLSHDAEDDCAEHGKWNHLKTRRGLRTHEEIQNWMATLPQDEVDARAHGKVNHKAGKVLKDFDPAVHVRAVDVSDPGAGAEEWNLYSFVDPHRKGYPFMEFWGVTPSGLRVCYNEWPTFDTFNTWYDEVRTKRVCPYTSSELAKFVKLYEGQAYGLRACKRGMDPYFAPGTEGEFGRKTGGILEDYMMAGVDFELPPRQVMDRGLAILQNGLKFDRQMPLDEYNRPAIVIASHCRNTIRAFQRHYWLDGKERQAEEFKDPIDVARGAMAMMDGRAWREEWTSKWMRNRDKERQNRKKVKPTGGVFDLRYRHMVREAALV